MRVALIGAGGQLASDLVPLFPDLVPLAHQDLDVADQGSVVRALDAARPEVVINTAAYNLVDRAEAEPERAYAVNAIGPAHLARYCGERGLTLVHFSTDYVFGLEPPAPLRPWRETDAAVPVSLYGASKLAGEHAVRALAPRHYVIRTCGLYGRAATRTKGNFVRTMLRLAGERPELRVVADQLCTPTFTRDVARATARLLQTSAYGLYHATNAGEASWYEIAREAVRIAGLATPVQPITTADYPTPARRPPYSRLDGSKLAAAIGAPLRPWREALAEYVTEIGAETTSNG